MTTEQPVPDEVTVIVHSAKGLQGKKPGRHKFSVIFGFGNKKYRTSIVKDPGGNPVWNEESVISVNTSSDTLFFNATEKEDILGQVSVPLSSLRRSKGRVVRTALQSHKKNSKPKGDLIYQCYISKYQDPDAIESEPKTGTNRWLKNNPFLTLTRSPVFPRKYFKKERKSHGAFSNLNKKISRSLHDLFSSSKAENSDEEDGQHQQQQPMKSKALSTFTLDCAGFEPEITYITPNKGLAAGGTGITIVGDNLGLRKSDIVTLSICGVDCLSTVEYESSRQVYCRTMSGQTGQGDFIIETISGGKTVLAGGFTLVPAAQSCEKEAAASASAASEPSTMVHSNRALSVSSPSLIPTLDSISTPNSPKSSPKPLVEETASLQLTPLCKKSSTLPSPKNAKKQLSSVSDSQIFTLNRTPEKTSHSSDANLYTIKQSPEKKKIPLNPNITVTKSPDKSHKNYVKESKENGSSIKENAKVKNSENIEGRFRKNFFKHLRNASDSPVNQNSAVIENGVSEPEVEKNDWAEKAKLAELERLQEENKALRLENADMKVYIEKLLAKVLHYCPEALASDGDLTPTHF